MWGRKDIAEKRFEKMNQSYNWWNSLSVQIQTNINFPFSASDISTRSSRISASSLNMSYKGNFATWQLQKSVITRFILMMNWNLPPYNFHPLVRALCLELHTQKTSAFASWLHFSCLKHEFPRPIQETKCACIHSLSSKILKPSYNASHSLLGMFLFVLLQHATSCQRSKIFGKCV